MAEEETLSKALRALKPYATPETAPSADEALAELPGWEVATLAGATVELPAERMVVRDDGGTVLASLDPRDVPPGAPGKILG